MIFFHIFLSAGICRKRYVRTKQQRHGLPGKEAICLAEGESIDE